MNPFADLQTFWDEIAARPDGPFAFRFYLQPFVATALALRDGIKDAKTGRSPYFWTIVHDSEHRAAVLKDGLRATGRVLALGICMDAAYQYFVLGTFRPIEMIVLVLGLCFLPYLLLRGPFGRLTRHFRKPHAESRQ